MTQRLVAGLCVAGLALPGVARAHSPIEGINYFYNGVLHPVFVPAHALLLIALGLWFGQRDLEDSQVPMLGFVVAMVAGFVVGPVTSEWIEFVQLACAATLAMLVVSATRLAQPWRVVAGSIAAFIVALDSVPDGPDVTAPVLSLIGTAVGMLLLLMYTMGMTDYLKKQPWQLIAVRVLGSWIAASTLLVVALSLAPGAS